MSKWLAKFHAGDFFLLRDAAWSGRPVAVIENHQHYTMRKTAKILKISKSSTVKSLASAWLIAFQTVRSRFRGPEVLWYHSPLCLSTKNSARGKVEDEK